MAVVTVSLVALIAGSVFVVRRSDGEVVARDEAPDAGWKILPGRH